MSFKNSLVTRTYAIEYYQVPQNTKNTKFDYTLPILTEATTEPVEGRYGGHATTLLYGVFTTPENSIPGSAVCAFTFQDIMDTFEGPFKGQASVNANWLPVHGTQVRGRGGG